MPIVVEETQSHRGAGGRPAAAQQRGSIDELPGGGAASSRTREQRRGFGQAHKHWWKPTFPNAAMGLPQHTFVDR